MQIVKTGRHELALVFAPHGRDAELAVALLGEAEILAISSADIEALVKGLNEDVTFVVASEEAIRRVDTSSVRAWVSAQPPWSDLPFMC